MTPDEIAAKFGGVPVDDADAVAAKFGGARAEQAPLSAMEKYLSNPLVRLAKGLKDPIDSLAQAAPYALNKILRQGVPQEIDMGGPTQAVSDWLASQHKSVNADIADSEREYQAAQKRAGTGTDAMRLIGNIASPANAIPAKAVPLGGFGTLGKAATGGAYMGGAGALLQPVTNEADQQNYGATKAIQAGAGAAVGAVMTPVMAKLAEIVVPRVTRFFARAPKSLSDADIDMGIRSALDGAKIKSETLPPEVMDSLRQQVRQGLATGRQIDVPSAARLEDAKALGVNLTSGQATRDPMQYAREVNLRGVENVGEPLMVRFNEQGGKLRGALESLTGNADEPYQAGTRIMGALKQADDQMAGTVRKAYQDVRAQSGKDASVPLQGLAQDAARIVDDFGPAVPEAIKARLARYGILPGQQGQQTKVFTYDEAEKLLQLINKHGSRTDDAVNASLAELRSSVKSAIADAGDDVFAGARSLAKRRFDLHDAIPGLEASAKDTMAPEDFVRRHIIGGKVDDVQQMGALLKQTAPDAFTDARSQIGSVLQRAAYGENAAGDRVFSPERFAKTLRTIGEDKLAAFYSPAEIETLNRIARVSGYIYAHPERAAVNTSNNSGWALSILQKLPMGNATLALVKSGAGVVARDRAVKSALSAQVPAKMSPQMEADLARLLGPAAVGFGITAAEPFR